MTVPTQSLITTLTQAPSQAPKRPINGANAREGASQEFGQVLDDQVAGTPAEKLSVSRESTQDEHSEPVAPEEDEGQPADTSSSPLDVAQHASPVELPNILDQLLGDGATISPVDPSNHTAISAVIDDKTRLPIGVIHASQVSHVPGAISDVSQTLQSHDPSSDVSGAQIVRIDSLQSNQPNIASSSDNDRVDSIGSLDGSFQSPRPTTDSFQNKLLPDDQVQGSLTSGASSTDITNSATPLTSEASSAFVQESKTSSGIQQVPHHAQASEQPAIAQSLGEGTLDISTDPSLMGSRTASPEQDGISLETRAFVSSPQDHDLPLSDVEIHPLVDIGDANSLQRGAHSGESNLASTTNVNIGPVQTNTASFGSMVETSNIEPIARQVTESIIQGAKLTTSNSQVRLELQIDPPELGPVFIELSESAEGMNARIVFTHHSTFQSVQSHVETIQAALVGAGIDLADFNLQHQTGHDSQEAQSNWTADGDRAERSLDSNRDNQTSIQYQVPAGSSRTVDLIV